VHGVADIALGLDGVGMNAALGCDRKARGKLHFAGRGEIEEAARFDDGTHRRRMRQRLQRVVQVDARQRPRELAKLRTNALAIDNEERRAKLRHEPANLGRLKRINKPFHRCRNF
jgi:hypothetical protein